MKRNLLFKTMCAMVACVGIIACEKDNGTDQTGNDGNNRGPNSDYWLRDASYLRLKSVEFGYTLPAKALKAIWLKNLRIYVTGMNLLTFDKIGILDPESSTSGIAYPLQRTFTIGLNLSF